MQIIKLLSPAKMTPCARAREICAILATEINRIYVANEPAESSVDLGFLLDQRVHTTPYQQEELS